MKKSICVVGAGYWGKNHIRTLFELQSLGGIVDNDKNSLDKITSVYPEIKRHSNLNDALNDNYDGYIIATPASTHFEIAKLIINAQKAVLIEKPMTLSISDAEELVRLAEEKKTNVLIGHVLLFHPAIRKIKEMIVNGSIGDLQYVYSNRLNLGKVRSQENVFWSLAPHDIAIFQHLTESYPKRINSIGSSFLQKGVPDSTITHIEYENGIEGHIFVSWLHPFKEHRLVIIGSEAMISFEDSSKGKPLKFYSKKFDLASGIPEKIDGPIHLIPYEYKMPLTLEIEYFINHLQDEEITFSTAEEGLEVVKILVESTRQLLK